VIEVPQASGGRQDFKDKQGLKDLLEFVNTATKIWLEIQWTFWHEWRKQEMMSRVLKNTPNR